MLRHVALVRTDVSDGFSASLIRATKIGELGTTLAVTSNRRTLRRNIKCSFSRLLVTASVVPNSPILVALMKEALNPSETSVLTRATRRNIAEEAILLSHRRENLKSYLLSSFINSCRFYHKNAAPVSYLPRVHATRYSDWMKFMIKSYRTCFFLAVPFYLQSVRVYSANFIKPILCHAV
jgi:hypothetical protein